MVKQVNRGITVVMLSMVQQVNLRVSLLSDALNGRAELVKQVNLRVSLLVDALNGRQVGPSKNTESIAKWYPQEVSRVGQNKNTEHH